MREIKISIETAQRWANGTDKELKALALQIYPELAKKELPKSWEELKEIEGYYINTNSGIDNSPCTAILENRNVFATKEQAEASIALAQLSQLREVYRQGWKPDYNNKNQNKHSIDFTNDKISKETYASYSAFLSFQDSKTRDLFLENFRDLIEKVKPLMS